MRFRALVNVWVDVEADTEDEARQAIQQMNGQVHPRHVHIDTISPPREGSDR